MTKSNVNTYTRQPIRLVTINSNFRKMPAMAEMLLTEAEQTLIQAFRATRPDYAICLLSSVAALAQEYPANPAPNLQLVRT